MIKSDEKRLVVADEEDGNVGSSGAVSRARTKKSVSFCGMKGQSWVVALLQGVLFTGVLYSGVLYGGVSAWHFADVPFTTVTALCHFLTQVPVGCLKTSGLIGITDHFYYLLQGGFLLCSGVRSFPPNQNLVLRSTRVVPHCWA